jgi:hypothetical protein
MRTAIGYSSSLEFASMLYVPASILYLSSVLFFECCVVDVIEELRYVGEVVFLGYRLVQMLPFPGRDVVYDHAVFQVCIEL